MHKGHRVRLFVTLGAALTLVVSVALVTLSAPIANPTKRHYGPVSLESGQEVDLTVSNLSGGPREFRVQLLDAEGDLLLNEKPTVQSGNSRVFSYRNESLSTDYVRARLVTQKEHTRDVVASLQVQMSIQRENQFMPTQMLSFTNNKVPAGPVIDMKAGASLQFLVTNLSSSATGPPWKKSVSAKPGTRWASRSRPPFP